MKSKLSNNWLYKVGSLVGAIILWLVVFNITDPISVLRIYDVPVQLLNTDLVTDNNQVYQVLGETDVIQSVVIEAKRSVINDIKESDVVVEADFNKLTMDGTIELNAYFARQPANIDKITLSNKTLQLSVENILEKYLPLTLEVVGETAEGYIVNDKSINQNQIYMSGPESILSTVDHVSAVVDLSNTRGNISTYAELILFDVDGNEVSQDRLKMNTKQVLANIEVWATKEVPVKYEVEGTPNPAYEWNGVIESEYETVKLKGKEADLDKVTEIVVHDSALTLNGAVDDVTIELDIDHYLPTGVVRNDTVMGGKFDVTLFVEKIISQEREIRVTNITYTHLPMHHTVTVVDKDQVLTVVLNGISTNLHDNAKNKFHVEVNCSEYLEDVDQLEEAVTVKVKPTVVIDDSIVAYVLEEVEIIIAPPATE